jgi:hypothetical protein
MGKKRRINPVSTRLAWKFERDGRVRLELAEACRGFQARTGHAAHGDNALEVILACVAAAMDEEMRQRRARQRTPGRRPGGRPALCLKLRQALRMLVDALHGSTADAALLMLIRGLDSSNAFPTRMFQSDDEQFDVRTRLRALEKRLDFIVRKTPPFRVDEIIFGKIDGVPVVDFGPA